MTAPKTASGFADLFEQVEETDDEIVVERDGKPVAVVMNPETYARLLDLERKRDWAIIDRVRAQNWDKDPDEVFADVTAEIEADRHERRSAERRDD